ncbi:hypothetical protein ACC713_18775 [Rhizobium johnstonii]|uniref:hypothetical protein n=1 Tax=Rhizobium johnstonii TaxID=3019933 RepID=UPI003F9757DD
MRFLGLSLSEKVPDAKTAWLFRQTSLAIRLSGQGWADRRCDDHSGSQAAQ